VSTIAAAAKAAAMKKLEEKLPVRSARRPAMEGGDLSHAEDERDEPEGGQRLVRADIFTHGGDHDRRNGPGANAEEGDGEIEEERRQVRGDQQVGQRLQAKTIIRPAFLPMRSDRVRRPGRRRGSGTRPMTRSCRRSPRKSPFLHERRDNKGRVDDIGVANRK